MVVFDLIAGHVRVLRLREVGSANENSVQVRVPVSRRLGLDLKIKRDTYTPDTSKSLSLNKKIRIDIPSNQQILSSVVAAA